MLDFARAQESDTGEIGAFLCRIFALPPTHRVFQPDVLRWKLFAPHPYWEGSRGLICRSNGQIVAHGCILPLRFQTAAGEVRAANIIDWAASREVPGAGLLLYRYAQEFVEGIIGVGGTEDTLAVLPRAGFKKIEDVQGWVRVVRPWQHAVRGSRFDVKNLLRLGRDWRELARRGPAPPSNWVAHAVERFDPALDRLSGESAAQPVRSRRTAALLNYLLGCPAASMRGFVITIDGQPRGHFLLATRGAECRICEWQLAGAGPDDEERVLSLILRAAAQDGAISSVWAATSDPEECVRLARGGFRLTSRLAALLLDRAGGRLSGQPLALGYPEYDGWYL